MSPSKILPSATVAALLVLCASVPAAAATVIAPQGGVARWAGRAAVECESYGKRYPAVAGVCYYPVDIRARPGHRTVWLVDKAGTKHAATLEITETTFSKINVDLPAELARYLDVSAEDEGRAKKETAEVARILVPDPGPAMFTLRLGKPAARMPKSQDDFGSLRSFNGSTHQSLHSGRDYPVSAHKVARAMAAGRVVLVADHFYTGNAVYIDHGGGLLTMTFHLESVAVKRGDTVRRGQAIGKVGSTGRSTGPHLHLGARWLGKRVDPALLLAPPGKLPSVSDTKSEAEEKIRDAENKEPPETDVLDEIED